LSYGWIEEEQLSYMIAVSESTPGPIMVNLATYIGSVKAGVPGALIATFAVVLPAFLIVVLLTLVLKNLVKKPAVQSMVSPLKACVTGIILATGAYMILMNCLGGFTKVSVDVAAILLSVILAVVYYGSRKIVKNGVSPILLICLAGIAGVLIYGWQ